MALSTTGTVQTSGWDTRTVIDRAYGALGLSPQQITSEKIDIAHDLLGITLADMLNTSVPLWCLEKTFVTPILGQATYPMPAGTNDINRAFYRSLFNITPATVTSSPTALQYDFGANNPTLVSMWSITYNGPLIPLFFQSSPDGVTWTTVETTNNFNLGSGPTQYYDIKNQGAQRYWQAVPQLSSNVLSIASASLWNTPNDIQMYRMNKDDYWNMTNKSSLGRPLQYWVNRTLGCEIRVWPEPDSITVSSVVFYIWRERYIMDVGSLQQQLEVPTRWFWTVIIQLADALALCTPEAKPDRIQMVQARLPGMLKNLWASERDRAPVKYNVNIGPYTK